MSRDGSGNYSLPQAAFVAGTTIESAKVNSNFSDIASALTESFSKDGQTVATASFDMGGFKLTNLGAATGSEESVRYDEFKMAFRSHLAGLQMSSRTNTTITYGAGSWTEDGQTQVYVNSGATIDCATTGALGLDTGSLANNTWYHAFAIAKTDFTTSLLASTSVSSPTMPTGYTLKRRIGSFKTNGSAQIIAFIQDGDWFQWVTPVADISANAPGTSAVTRTLASIPTGVNVEARLIGSLTNNSAGTGTSFMLYDLAATGSTIFAETGAVITAASGVSVWRVKTYARTNTSAQIGSIVGIGGGLADSNVTLGISVLGWIDRRGRDA